MIPIQNIYYMLSYAFQVLNKQGFKDISTEKFDNAADLLAAILIKGISIQIKRGLLHEYIETTEPLSGVRGSIEIADSIKKQTLLSHKMICTYDDFSVNCYMNRILKTAIKLLLHTDITSARKKELRKLLLFFKDVESLDKYHIDWNLYYHKNNQTYRMLISICYLAIKGLIQTQSDGTTKLMNFVDEQQMSRLYERFVLEYYRKEFPELDPTASQIPWALDDDKQTMLPIMQSDITLTYNHKSLIIDTKYYSRTLQKQFNTYTIHSANLYQIFTYVKNKSENDCDDVVSGMLLYAKTNTDIQPNCVYQMSGNQISVKTLDLNKDFSEIRNQLNQIVFDHFGFV